MNMQIFLFSFITAPIDIYLLSDLFKDNFDKQRWYRIAFIPVSLFCMGLLSFVNSFEIFAVNIIFYVFVYFLYLLILYQAEIVKKLVAAAVFLMISIVAEIVMGILYIFFVGTPIEDVVGTNMYARTLTAIGLYIVELILIKLWKKFFGKKRYDADEKMYVLLLLFPLITGLISAMFVSLSSVMTLAQYRKIFVLELFMLIADIILFLYMERMMALKQQQKEYALLQQKNEMESKYYKRMEEVNQEQAIYRHDMKHYLEAIGGLAEEGRIDELKKLKGEMYEELNRVERIRYTGNEIFNVVLWEKKEYAEKLGIEMQMQIEPGADTSFVKDIDLITIIGNVLDNAIEAVRWCTDDKKIDISLYETDGNFILFEVQNPFVKEPVMKKGKLLTVKSDAENHGMGVESVRKVVEKYGGILDVTMEGHNFKVTISLAIGYVK